MKKTSIIALLALPLAGLVSCSDKEEAPAKEEAKALDKEEAPAKEEAKALTTAEDYMNAMVDCMNEFASIIEATTVENSADQAKKITALVEKMQNLRKEVEAKGFDKTEPNEAMQAKMEQVGARVGKAIMEKAPIMEQLDPSFIEAMEKFGN